MNLRTINLPIIVSFLSLLSISILVIFSSSPELAFQQAIFGFIGVIFYILIANLDYRALTTIIKPGLIITILLLVFVFILGVETRGSVRWIPLGFINIQPSEFAKPVIILALAYFWSKHYPDWRNISKSLLMISPILFLVFKQPDLGTTLTIGSLWIGLLFAANVSFKKLILMLSIFLVLIPVFWLTLQDYQRQRVFTFITPNRDPLGVGYNIIQSTISVGSGQLTGRGLGRGTQSRLQFLPEYRTDFIFAAIAEELGFVGTLLLITIYLFLISYCLYVARGAIDIYGSLIAVGVSVMIIFQTIVNIGMNIGILPITGITLPLISYGGSSLIATLISLGLVASVAKYKKRFDIETLGR